MIKGINKQILEVTNTESPYFERIIFFVRPSSQNMTPEKLQREAEKISEKAKKPPKARRSKKQIVEMLAYSLLGLGAGGALSYILNNFIHFG